MNEQFYLYKLIYVYTLAHTHTHTHTHLYKPNEINILVYNEVSKFNKIKTIYF